MIEQFVGLKEKYQGAGHIPFITLLKKSWDHPCGAMALNIKREILVLRKRQIETPILRATSSLGYKTHCRGFYSVFHDVIEQYFYKNSKSLADDFKKSLPVPLF